MNQADYPALWKSSNAASNASQRRFFALIRIHLSLLAFTGLVAGWTPTDPTAEKVVGWAVAGSMFIAFVLALAIKLRHLDDNWFEARAFAENTKEAAWRYMMQPKESSHENDDGSRQAFLESLNEIRKRFPGAAKKIASFDVKGKEITAKMEEIRSTSTSDRCTLYELSRVQDQIDWYTDKAKVNADLEARWFWIILAAEALAVATAIIRLAGSYHYDPTSGIAAMAACFVAWLQTKRFSDLANTYNVAAVDLRMIKERFGGAQTESELSRFVEESETAISREHRLWIEKRIGSG